MVYLYLYLLAQHFFDKEESMGLSDIKDLISGLIVIITAQINNSVLERISSVLVF